MSLVNNLQILFKLNGQCDLVKEGHDTFVRVWNHDELFCYQGWDLITYKLNALKRKTFTIPLSQFVNAANNFNHFNPNNTYRPSLVMTLENNNVAVVTATEFSIEPYSNANPVETLKIKILENYEKIVDKDHIKLRKQNDLSEDLKFSQSKKMNFMFSEMSYKQLNYNNFLTELNVVHSDIELNSYADRWLDLSDCFSLRGYNFRSYNYLFQNNAKIKRTRHGFKLLIKNPSHILKFQGWHEHSITCNNVAKRDLHAITASEFMMSMFESHEIAYRTTGSVSNFGFQPTCYIEIESLDKTKKSTYIGVMKSFAMDNNFKFLSDNSSNLEINISLSQIDTGLLGTQIINEFEGEEYFVRMNIDAEAETDGAPPFKTVEIPENLVKDLAGMDPTTNKPNSLSTFELCDLTILYNNALELYDRLINPSKYNLKDKRGDPIEPVSDKTAATQATLWFSSVVRDGKWKDSNQGKIDNVYNVDVRSIPGLENCTPPVSKNLCDNHDVVEKLPEDMRKKLCPTAGETAEKVTGNILGFVLTIVASMPIMYGASKLWGNTRWSDAYKAKQQAKAENEAGQAREYNKGVEEAEAQAKMEVNEKINESPGMEQYNEMKQAREAAKTEAGNKAYEQTMEEYDGNIIEKTNAAKEAKKNAEEQTEKDFMNSENEFAGENAFTIRGRNPNDIVNDARLGLNNEMTNLAERGVTTKTYMQENLNFQAEAISKNVQDNAEKFASEVKTPDDLPKDMTGFENAEDFESAFDTEPPFEPVEPPEGIRIIEI